MSLKSPINGIVVNSNSNTIGSTAAQSNSISTTTSTTTSNSNIILNGKTEINSIPKKEKVVVVIGQDNSSTDLDSTSSSSSSGSVGSGIHNHYNNSISASNSPINIRSPSHKPPTSALPPISIGINRNRLSVGNSNGNSSNTTPTTPNHNPSSNSPNNNNKANSFEESQREAWRHLNSSNNNNSPSPNNKPLPKPPSFKRELTHTKKQPIPIDMNNVPQNILQKTLSEGDINMIHSDKSNLNNNSNSNNLNNLPSISPENNGLNTTKRRAKSNSITELQRDQINSPKFFPPLPPVPQLVKESSSSSLSLPPLPPVPFKSDTQNIPIPPQTPPILHLQHHGSVSSSSMSPTYAPMSPPTLSSSSSSSSSSLLLNISGSMMSNSTSSPNLQNLNSSNSNINNNNNNLPNERKQRKVHSLKPKYFTQPTKCQICCQYIWTLIGKQGYICSDCGFAVHKACCPKTLESCPTSSSPPKRKNSDFNISEPMIYDSNNNMICNQNIQVISDTCSSESESDGSPTSSTSTTNRLSSSQSLSNHLSNSTSFNQLSTSNSTGNLSILINGNNISPNHNNSKKSRNSIDSTLKDFRDQFKSYVPSDENLLATYNCAYQAQVSLKPGKLFITENFLCFYDNIVVFDKNKLRTKVIPFASIKSIEKKTGLALNGILVKTEERDYHFCLFHRDEVFEIIEVLLLYQEKVLLSESIKIKNLDGVKHVLNQQKSRIGGSSKHHTKKSKSVDNYSTNSVTLMNSTNDDEPPLITVIKNNDIEMIQLLLEYYNSNKSDEINDANSHGYTPLHVAVSSDAIHDNIVIHLLKSPNIKVSERNMDGNTPLHYFCQKFRSPECQKIVQLFIEQGADVNSHNNNGETPLHKAIFNNSVRLLMVNVLLKNNANVNIVNIAGESPLHYAVRLGRLDVLKALINAGADATLVSTKEKKTPLNLAEEGIFPEIIDLLRRLEIIINSLTMSNLLQYRMALILEELSQEGSLSRLDENMMVNIGCYDEDHKKLLYALKNKKILYTGPPAVTPGANELLKELENMDVKNGKWIISQQDLEYTDKIGSGVSGKVYKGLYKGREVAIKVLKSAEEAHNREEFLKEFNVLASLQSSLIVGLYGVVLEPRICLVMEYCQKGSLYQVLHNDKIDWEKFFSFSFQLLKGISTLHLSQPQIVHRDVKTLNFLVTKDARIKVADFGLSRFNTKSNQMTLNKTRGTSAYCAPEVFQGQEYSEKSDVYSLGVVFWELIYSVINQRYLHPYGEYRNLNEFQIMLNTANLNLRPTIPPNAPQSIKNLVTSCWDKEPDNRPTCVAALVQLQQCEKEYQSNPSLWNEIIKPKSYETDSSSSDD